MLLRRLLADEEGLSIVELALVAPILATMVIGVVDLSNGVSQKLVLQQVAQRLVERAMQGMQGDDSTQIFQALQLEGAEAAGVPSSQVTIRFWLACNGVSQNTSQATMLTDYEERRCPDDRQVYSRHLNVRITKTFTPFFNMRWAGAGADGNYTLVGEAGLRVQ
jgi:Flp pilus assembly protein TadG